MRVSHLIKSLVSFLIMDLVEVAVGTGAMWVQTRLGSSHRGEVNIYVILGLADRLGFIYGLLN